MQAIHRSCGIVPAAGAAGGGVKAGAAVGQNLSYRSSGAGSGRGAAAEGQKLWYRSSGGGVQSPLPPFNGEGFSASSACGTMYNSRNICSTASFKPGSGLARHSKK